MFGTDEGNVVKAARGAETRLVPADPKISWSELVSSWSSGDDALRWAASKGITAEQLGNSPWLTKTSGFPKPKGIGESLSGLYKAIRKDTRFQTDGKPDFDRFKVFIGVTEATTYAQLLSGWNDGQDALRWAASKGITAEQLGNSKWLGKTSQLPKPEGIGQSLCGLYYAIKKDTRFQTDGKPDFDRFKVFIGVTVATDYTQLLSSWNDGQDALRWAASKGITAEQLGNSTWLGKTSQLPKPEGIGQSLRGLYKAIKKDTRFQTDGKPDFDRFKVFIGVTVASDYTQLLSSWNDGQDALRWAASKGITAEQLGNSTWLGKTSQLPKPEGIGESLYGLYHAITKDTRFQTDGKPDFDRFKVFIGVTVATDYAQLLSSWNDGQDALRWAASKGITAEQLGNSKWLGKTSQLPKPEGIGQSLSGLYYAITKDTRFQTDGKPDFDRFKVFIGVTVASDYTQLLSSWNDGQDALRWAASKGISAEQLGNSQWLNKTSQLPKPEGIGESLVGLYKAIRKDTRFPDFDRFKVFIGVISNDEIDVLRELFLSPEAAQLRNLAEKLGESALAEYLVAAHPDKFQAYGPELLENLRPYLGELEQTPRAIGSEDIPNEVFYLDKLAYLRQALFNHYRDLLQHEYAKGLEVVTERIEKKKRGSSSVYEHQFLDSLGEYFREVDTLAHPSRLKESLDGALRFPAAHQMMAMYEVAQARRILLADEMGGGKTGSAIGSFELLRDQKKARRALVICPAKVVPVWRERLSNSSDGYFKDEEAPEVACIDSNSKDWLAAARADYTVISLEMLRGKTDGVSNEKKLMECGFDFLIFDEAHNAKSIGDLSSDTARVFAVSQSPGIRDGYTILLSGTPIPNTLRDLAAHIRLLYAGTNDQPGIDVNDLQTLARQILTSHPLTTRNLLVRKMMRRKTEDCLPVGCAYTREELQAGLNPLARAHYAAVLADPFLTASTKIEALRRICLNAKFETLRNAIEKALRDEKYQSVHKPAKIVVAESWYARGVTRDVHDKRSEEAAGKETYLYSRLRNTYGDAVKVFVLDGKNSADRAAILAEFEGCATPAILLTLLSVSGEGLDITCAADGILISPTYTVSSEEQFIRRMLRSGQKLPVRLQVLSFSDSIEEGIASYSARKHRAVAAVMDGRPLNQREKAILEDDFASMKRHGPIAYESLTPRQQALWILSRLKGLGKDGIRAFLYADDGKYAKEFARAYPVDEETSLSGNTARLVAAVIERLGSGASSPKIIADIACGCRTLERMFEGSRALTVKSVDINEVALSAGAGLLKTPKETTQDEVRTMDDLPFDDGSIDIGVISLALHMTQHSFNSKREKTGQERIRTLLEINRTLKNGGTAILSFPESLFPSETDFSRFVSTIEHHFGFRRVDGLTGLVKGLNGAESEHYASWIVVLEKTSPVTEVDTASEELQKGLRFPRVSRGVQAPRSASPGAATGSSGAYQDTFLIGGTELTFGPSTMPQVEACAEHKRSQADDIRLGQKVDDLLRRYPNIRDIPPELLLSITPRQVGKATQIERDSYYRLLIQKYGSEESIPTERITDQNSHILIRKYHETKGHYLVLAKLSKDGRSWVTFNTRYFYEGQKE